MNNNEFIKKHTEELKEILNEQCKVLGIKLFNIDKDIDYSQGASFENKHWRMITYKGLLYSILIQTDSISDVIYKVINTLIEKKLN
jgi:hypothetical protein